MRVLHQLLFVSKKMKKKVLTCLIVMTFTLSVSLKSYSQSSQVVYIVKPDLFLITKGDFCKADSLLVNCENSWNCKIIGFTIFISGASRHFKYTRVYGNKIPNRFRKLVKAAADTAVVAFDDIKLAINGNSRYM